MIRCLGWVSIATWSLALPAAAQLVPHKAHVNLYFPQFADGGNSTQKWQTRLILTNPTSYAANAWVSTYGNDGKPLALNFGAGPASETRVRLEPGATTVLESRMESSTIVTGWAFVDATAPLLGTLVFRMYEGGQPRFDLTTNAALPTPIYVSAATPQLGIALANPFINRSVGVRVTAVDANGTEVGHTDLSLGASEHISFNLLHRLPTLPAGFRGSVLITSLEPADRFVAWTLAADGAILSTLPPGESTSPVSHWDRIWLVYSNIYNAANELLTVMGMPLNTAPIELDISEEPVINAYAQGGRKVMISLALAQLISDSESEIAFVMAHELAHIVQQRYGGTIIDPSNRELDADQVATWLLVAAGYDPYAGAGALAKLAMATGQSGLVVQAFADEIDVHRSLNTRMETMFGMLTFACSLPSVSAACNEYKRYMHPNFPDFAPLDHIGSKPGARAASRNVNPEPPQSAAPRLRRVGRR